jgi:hypothetical protein
MEPKFQSSFIPKGPISSASGIPAGKPVRRGGLYSYISLIIFIISLVLAVGVFGYRFYVKGTINRMSEEIADKKDTLIPNSSREFIRLNDRIQSTQELLNSHVVTSPLFEYLESSTLKSVRFTELSYNTAPNGVELVMRGEASGYAAVALQADIFNKGSYFKDSNFSDLSLDEKGNVTFTYQAKVNPSLISYQKQVEEMIASQPAVVAPATTTPDFATSSPETTATTTESDTNN